MTSKVVKVTIKDKEYNLKAHSYRALFMFEEMTGKQITDISTLKDQITLLYCLFKGNNKDFELSFDDFIDVIEEDESIFQKFVELNDEAPVQKKSPRKKKVKQA